MRTRTLARLAWLAAGLVLALPAAAQDWIYSARPGDNLWNLAERYLVKGTAYTERLRRHNSIENPLRIPAGTRIRMPIAWLKLQPASARLVQTVGEVTLHRAGGGAGATPEIGTEIRIGDRIVTGALSAANIEFADGSRLLLQAGTDLAFDAMSAYEHTGMVDTTLRLQAGRVESDVERSRGPGSRYRIVTPAAVAAVRGTRFRAGFDPDSGQSRNEVTEGTVGVAAERVSRRVAQGFGVLAAAGEAPSKPVPLLPAPAIDAFPARAERLLLAFDWPPVPGAHGYRAQLYPADDPSRLLLDKLVAGPKVEWNAPPDGDYVLRLRAIDADGLEGLNADHPFVLHARPVPPSLIEPMVDGKHFGPGPTFGWGKPAEVADYHLQVASDPSFQTLLVDVDGLTDPTHTLPEPLEPASYHWRVAMRDTSGRKGPFGDPRKLRVLVVPAAPGAGESSVDEGRVVLGWGRAADAVRYEFQLARDAEFTELVIEDSVTGREYVLDDPDPGEYFFRVRGVSGEDVPGPYTPANSFEVPAEPWHPLSILLLIPLLLL